MEYNARRHQVLLSFTRAPEQSLAVLRANATALMAAGPQIKNNALRELALASVNHFFELAMLRVCDVTKLLNIELSAQGLEKLKWEEDPVLYPVFKMRNKLLAHRIENLADSDEYVKWYQSHVGTMEQAFDAVMRAANLLAVRIEEMFQQGRLYGIVVHRAPDRGITLGEISEILEALRSAGLN